MPKIAEIKEMDGEVWVRVGKCGEFANGLAIMSPEEISAKEREYSKAYDHGHADAMKYMEERDSEREIVTLTAADKYDIADCITTESRSKTDVVQDVFDELAERFDIRRKA